MKVTSANGLTGMIIHTMGNYWFRVTDKDGTFTDYSILHCDLCVTINDEDAYLYERNGHALLDHSPETLGFKEYTSHPIAMDGSVDLSTTHKDLSSY